MSEFDETPGHAGAPIEGAGEAAQVEARIAALDAVPEEQQTPQLVAVRAAEQARLDAWNARAQGGTDA